MPAPKCATAVPQAERGSPRARANAMANGTRNRPTRSIGSISAPIITIDRKPDAERRQHRPAALDRKGDGERR